MHEKAENVARAYAYPVPHPELNVIIYVNNRCGDWTSHKSSQAGNMPRPDSTQAPIPLWGEYDDGMQSSAAPPPYSLESSATPRATPSRSNSHQKLAHDAPTTIDSSYPYSRVSSSSTSVSPSELGTKEDYIPTPGDTGVTRRSSFSDSRA